MKKTEDKYKKEIIDPGDGYRCNGGTFFTNLFLKKFFPGYSHFYEEQIKWEPAVAFAEKLTVPSKSYAKLIARVNGWNPDGTTIDQEVKMAGIAHITGGGIWGKFGEILPEGVGANLNNMPKPPDVLLEAQEMSQDIPELRLTDFQAYSTFHGGCGMLVVCETFPYANRLVKEAAKDGVEASIVGETVKKKGNKNIIIKSRFLGGKTLSLK